MADLFGLVGSIVPKAGFLQADGPVAEWLKEKLDFIKVGVVQVDIALTPH